MKNPESFTTVRAAGNYGLFWQAALLQGSEIIYLHRLKLVLFLCDNFLKPAHFSG